VGFLARERGTSRLSPVSPGFPPAYTYDASSNRTGFTDPESGSTSYVYDTLNRLTALTPPSAFSGGSAFGFSYDALSRRTQMTRPNSVTTNYTYDNLSRLLSVLHQEGGSTIDGASYTLDSAGNRTAKVDDLASVTSDYTYDPIYELTQVTQAATTTESYTYDPVGNRTASLGVSSYTTNASNELTSDSEASYAYDYNGNTTSKTDSTGTTNYSWDYENRLTSVTLPDSGGTVTLKYDPFGRRIYKQSPTATSVFAYDADNLIETVNSSGGVVARYTQDRDIDEPLAMMRGTITDYYEQDGIGSVTSLSSFAGALVQTYTYDSFGSTTNSSGSLTNFFRYAAREFDTETNLYDYRARYYDPGAGRFIKEDPIQFGSGDPNFYDYVENDATNYTDPTGRLRYPGTNWCGPNWTGGRVEEYDPAHANLYKPPTNRYDTVCMHHDICYFNCRSAHPCDPKGRSNCFKTCDQIFVGEMPGWGFTPDFLTDVIFWHGKFGPSPEANRPDLAPGGCCGAKP